MGKDLRVSVQLGAPGCLQLILLMDADILMRTWFLPGEGMSRFPSSTGLPISVTKTAFCCLEDMAGSGLVEYDLVKSDVFFCSEVEAGE